MQKIAVVADSGLDIPQRLLEEHNIVQVPVHVHWQGRQYRDKLDLQLEDLFTQGRGSKDFPTTSQPSPGEFADVYRKLAEKYDVILSWHIASALSGTWASARAGAKMLAGSVEILVLDTRSVSMGGGLQAIAAAQALKQGASLDQIISAGELVREKVDIRLVLNTLDYVLRGGRIGRLEATLGSILNIKPMLAVKDGVIGSAGRARSRAKSMDMLVKTVTEACVSPQGSGFVVAIGHAGAQEDMETVSANLTRELPQITIIPYQVGVAIGAHGGPGVLGACYYNE